MRSTAWLIPLVLTGLSGRDTVPLTEVSSPRRDAASPISVHNGQASFHVPAPASGRIVLIISSLGRSSRQFPIHLTASDFVAGPRVPVSVAALRAVRPFPNNRPPPPVARPPLRPTSPIILASVPRPQRTFDLPLLNGQPGPGGDSVRVRSQLIAQGQRTTVYADETIGEPTSSTRLAHHVIDLLESQIMPLADYDIGRPADVDGDGRLAILLTPWLGRLQGGRTSVGGFVRGADFRPDARPGSNRADMIYLNANLVPGDRLRDILAHEYQHVLACSQRDAIGRHPEEDWLNEAIAHLAEPGSTNIRARVNAYLSNTPHYPLVVPDYFRAGRWRCAGCRGATYLFLAWCRHQHGAHLAGSLLRSPWSGVDNLTRVTATSFPVLFRDWSVAMLSYEDDGMARSPRVRDWDTLTPLALQLHGTSMAFVSPRISTSHPRIFRVDASPEALLQITVTLQSSTEPPRPRHTVPVP